MMRIKAMAMMMMMMLIMMMKMIMVSFICYLLVTLRQGVKKAYL